jgi:hypothetical protein
MFWLLLLGVFRPIFQNLNKILKVFPSVPAVKKATSKIRIMMEVGHPSMVPGPQKTSK